MVKKLFTLYSTLDTMIPFLSSPNYKNEFKISGIKTFNRISNNR